MRNWSFPQVQVNYFATNEFVAAACEYSPVEPINTSLNYGMDFVDENDNLVFDGPADGNYKKSSYELIRQGELPSAFANASFNPNGYWFKNKNLYLKKGGSVPSSGVSFSNENYFEYVGTYDVYVTTKGLHFWFYAPGTADGGTPSSDKNFS